MKYKVNPFPAVRVNGKNGRFMPRAKLYHNKMNELRTIIGNDKEKILKLLLSGDYELIFYLPMAKSWSIKKILKNYLEPHKQTPDTDNLYKAFTDTIFFGTEYNDSAIFTINCKKVWDYEGYIEINQIEKS